MTVLTGEAWSTDVLLPHRPYATNALARGQYRMSRDDALTMRYIEHSPHALLGSIVIDCDHPDAAMRAFEQPSDHPAPNWVAQSPSGRAHLGWWLGPHHICRTDSALLAPLRLAHRIERGLCISVGGDFAYGGQLTKNPIHPDWETIYGPADPYTLRELITVHTPRQISRRPDRVAGLGRNVTMFDTARTWAYPQWWHHRNGTVDQWLQLVLQRCHAINTQFADPLPFVEVQATAHSIGKWIWRNFDEEEFRARQSARGKIVTPAKIEANRARATRFDRELVREVSRGC
ncbi:replication initiation protein [Rhodococcus marinonascens]|uniref:replication initiation protein n=1 Tax=Rhodococcus marinonascens TaxID=38311 RepID=UPI0009348463|nr:replication initiation protein [Rhodococcus marinonascens]